LLGRLRSARAVPALLLLFCLGLHSALSLLASPPSAAERALLAELRSGVICTTSAGAAGNQPDSLPQHDPFCDLCGIACTMAACAAVAPTISAAERLDLPVGVLAFPGTGPNLSVLAVFRSDIASRAPPLPA